MIDVKIQVDSVSVQSTVPDQIPAGWAGGSQIREWFEAFARQGFGLLEPRPEGGDAIRVTIERVRHAEKP